MKKIKLSKIIIFRIVTIFFLLFSILAVTEVCLRILGKINKFKYETVDYFFYSPDKNIGLWMSDPDNSRKYINSFGMYDVARQIEKKEGVFRIAVLGDSFMNGVHVRLGNRLSDLLEKKFGNNTEVLNFGISSVGTVQELFIYRYKVRQFKPDLVILGFLTDNDVRNNHRLLESAYGYGHSFLTNAPYCEKKVDGSFEYKPATLAKGTNKISYYLRKYSYVYRFLRLDLYSRFLSFYDKRYVRNSPEIEAQYFWPLRFIDYGVYSSNLTGKWKDAWGITEYSLLSLKKEVEADNAKFLLVILTDNLQIVPNPAEEVKKLTGKQVPLDFDVDYPNRRLADFASKNNIDCVNLLPVFRRYSLENKLKLPYFSFKNDGHWNKLGHLVASEVVYGFIKERYVFNKGQ